MKLSARQAMRTRSQSRRLGNFGKQWKSGDVLRCFYPLFWNDDIGDWDILVAEIWGHSINPKAISLKRIFVPTLAPIVDGKPEFADVTAQFSRISRLFLQGDYDGQVAALERKGLPQSQSKSALKQLDKDFEIDDEGRIGISPVVGPLKNVISTEVVTVTTNDNKPDVENARLVTQDLSDSKLKALFAILGDQQFYVGDPTEEEKEGKTVRYLEIQYAFGTEGDKKIDGKVNPTGITKNFSIESTYPELWPRIKVQIDNLPDCTETIQKRNSSYSPCAERDIITALGTFTALKSEFLDNLSEEDNIERLINNVEVIDKFQVPIQNAELLEALAEKRAERAELSIISDDPTVKEEIGAPKLDDLKKDEIENARRIADEAAEAGDENVDLNMSEMAGVNG